MIQIGSATKQYCSSKCMPSYGKVYTTNLTDFMVDIYIDKHCK
jgi:hypothetical protein